MENGIFSGSERMLKAAAKPAARKIFAVTFTVYTFWFVIQVPQVYFYNLQSKQPVAAWFFVYRLALASYVWAALAPIIFKFGRRFPIGYDHLWRNLTLHLLFGCVCGFVQTACYLIGTSLVYFENIASALSPLANPAYFLNFLSLSLFHYITVASIYQAYLYFRESRDREFRLQQAELQSLKTQLHPHFLFNALNAVSSLTASSPKTAQKTIAQLSDLLRVSLRDGRTQEITLKEELHFTRKYVEIQQTLLQERLEVEWKIDSETLDALVPSLILQPLVENSIRHGIAPRETGGCLRIVAGRSNGMLAFDLSDDGLGFDTDLSSEPKRGDGGIGLTNTRARLRYLYGDAHEFALSETTGGGVRVKIKIPFREQTETDD